MARPRFIPPGGMLTRDPNSEQGGGKGYNGATPPVSFGCTVTADRQRRSTQERQLEIADAALRVIAEKGIAAFTMDRLAREIGMTSGALFRHFASREAILAAAVARAEALLRASFPSTALGPLARIEAFVQARTALVGSNAGLAQLVFSEQFTKALDGSSRERLQQVMEASQRFLGEALSEGQTSGSIRRDLPADHLSALIMGLILATLLIRRTRGTEPSDLWPTVRTLLSGA